LNIDLLDQEFNFFAFLVYFHCINVALTMLNLLSLATSDETANAVTQQAASEKYVLMTARYWLSPVTSAALNDGQNTHRNSVPEIWQG
jgi:hypothetical protein